MSEERFDSDRCLRCIFPRDEISILVADAMINIIISFRVQLSSAVRCMYIHIYIARYIVAHRSHHFRAQRPNARTRWNITPLRSEYSGGEIWFLHFLGLLRRDSTRHSARASSCTIHILNPAGWNGNNRAKACRITSSCTTKRRGCLHVSPPRCFSRTIAYENITWQIKRFQCNVLPARESCVCILADCIVDLSHATLHLPLLLSISVTLHSSMRLVFAAKRLHYTQKHGRPGIIWLRSRRRRGFETGPEEDTCAQRQQHRRDERCNESALSYLGRAS